MKLVESNIEVFLIIGMFIPYFWVIGKIQNKYLKGLKTLHKINVLKRMNKPHDTSKAAVISNKITNEILLLKNRSPFRLLLPLILHVSLYLILTVSQDQFRPIYLITIIVEYVLSVILVRLNFWMKGGSVLQGMNDSGALPG